MNRFFLNNGLVESFTKNDLLSLTHNHYIKMILIRVSSKGRKAEFDSVNGGSNPSTLANFLLDNIYKWLYYVTINKIFYMKGINYDC